MIFNVSRAESAKAAKKSLEKLSANFASSARNLFVLFVVKKA